MRMTSPVTRKPMRSTITLGLAAAVAVTAAARGLAQPEPTAQPPEADGVRVVTVASGIEHPWGLAWLPDGRALVTARPGRLYLLDNDNVQPVPMQGLPDVFAVNQGGLMDISVHPRDTEHPRIYMTLSTGTESANRTVLVRGRFDGRQVSDIETLFRAQPDKSGGEHFGSRLLWLPDGTLLMSIGDGGNPPRQIGGILAREQAQRLDSHLGSVVRLDEDGRAPRDNPFVDREGALPEIWSYGHRNVQGLTLADGRVWATEHGPFGGDELNQVDAGRNYGWPLQTQGRDYRTRQAIGTTSVEGMVDPRVVWTPAHAPSGLAFYTGDRLPEWRGSLVSGGLVSEDLRRLDLDARGHVQRQSHVPVGERVRDVREGPDGYLYALTDESNGRVIRLEPTAAPE